jgi:SAM-dependent methyltransferase
MRRRAHFQIQHSRGAWLTPLQVADAIRGGRCPADRAFDSFLPDALRAVSNRHWTPLSVVERAARWLDELDVRTVVDVGSGAGKFCVAAALAGRCSFVGLEQRPALVAAARALATLFELEDRVRFVEGSLGDIEVPVADAYYFFNPFGENLHDAGDCIDKDVELNEARYEHDVALAEELLRSAPHGTLLLTYNGFGGCVPTGYQQIRVDRETPSVLGMWQRVTSPASL